MVALDLLQITSLGCPREDFQMHWHFDHSTYVTLLLHPKQVATIPSILLLSYFLVLDFTRVARHFELSATWVAPHHLILPRLSELLKCSNAVQGRPQHHFDALLLHYFLKQVLGFRQHLH